MRVTYASCTIEQFAYTAQQHQLIPGRLYWLKDVGNIMRATSESTFEPYSDQVHVVDDYPVVGVENNLYVHKSTGRAKVYSNGVYINVVAGNGVAGPMDMEELQAILDRKTEIGHKHTLEDIEGIDELISNLQWKTP